MGRSGGINRLSIDSISEGVVGAYCIGVTWEAQRFQDVFITFPGRFQDVFRTYSGDGFGVLSSFDFLGLI